MSDEPRAENASALSTPAANMLNTRSNFGGALLNDGRVLMVGGVTAMASAELYHLTPGIWTATASLSTGRFGHSVTKLADGRVFVSGGRGPGTTSTLPHELYTPSTGLWTMVGSDEVRYLERAVLLADGRVLRSGGLDFSTTAVSIARLWNPSTLSSSSTGAMTFSRHSHTLTRLPNGRVLAAGGSGHGHSLLATAELYNPATGTWSATGSMTRERGSHTATLLPSGKVLVAGGYVTSGATATAELYDPATGTWTETGSLAEAHVDHAAELEPSGTVLVMGGAGSTSAIATVERFNPATGTWSTTTPLITARRQFAAVSLGGDQYLVAGGFNGDYLSSAELYTACQPTTCAAQSATCGPIPDGCGGTIQCGACSGTDLCTNSVCVAAPSGGLAAYDATLLAPRCSGTGALCDSGTLLNGRGSVGPELNAPNTLGASCPDASGGTYLTDSSLERLRVVSVNGGPLTAGTQVRLEATVWAGNSTPANGRLLLQAAGKASSPVWQTLGTLTPSVSGPQTLSVTYTLPAGTRQAVRGAFYASPFTPSCSQAAGSQDVDDLAFSVVDAAPSVSITAPALGTTVSGTVTLSANASDDVEVKWVRFYAGTRYLGTAASPPFQATWPSALESNGAITLRARVEDTGGQVTESAVKVIVYNGQLPPPPPESIAAPRPPEAWGFAQP